jgi:hypothetical protein
MPGEFLDPVGSIQTFVRVVDDVMRLPELDPKRAFRTATPGAIGDLVEQMGPWEGRGGLRFEMPGVTQGVKAIGRDQRMLQGTDKISHIVALPGFELAGFSHTVHPEDFAYGLTAERARDLAAKPVLNFNDGVAHILMDIITSGDYSGSITDDFQWSAKDLDDNTASQQIITDDANQVPNVFANSTQTILWPLRNGTQTAVNHDHLSDTGAVWSAANAKTQADNIREHPTMGRIRAYVGSTVAAAVQAAKKSDFTNTVLIKEQVENSFSAKGSDFGFASPIGIYEDIEYHHMVDLPASGVLMVAAGTKPFHAHIGYKPAPGINGDKGAWTRNHAENDELLGMTWGFRKYFSGGVKNPLAATYGEHAA